MGPNRTAFYALALAVGPHAILGREHSAGPLHRLGSFFSGRRLSQGDYSPADESSAHRHEAAATLAVLASVAARDGGPTSVSDGPVAGGAAETRELDEYSSSGSYDRGRPGSDITCFCNNCFNPIHLCWPYFVRTHICIHHYRPSLLRHISCR